MSGFCVLLSLSATASAQAPDHLTYRAWAGFEYSDNAFHRSQDGSGDLLFAPGLSYSVLHASERWRVRGDGDLRMERGGEGSGAQPRARATLGVDWALLPQRLYWSVEDFAEVQSVDALAADTPSNRQQTNLFQTGPVLLFGSPRTVTGRVEAQLARATAGLTPDFDHDRRLLAATLTRQTDATLSWSAALESTRVDFRHAPFGTSLDRDFRRHDLLLSRVRELQRTALVVSVGASRIEFDGESEAGGPVRSSRNYSRPLARMRLRYTPNARHEFGALLRSELSDAGRELVQERDPVERFRSEVRRSQIGSDIFTLRSADLHWQLRGVTSQLRVAAFVRHYDYLRSGPQPLSGSAGARLDYTYALTPQTRINAHLGTESYRFEDSARHDRDRYVGVDWEHDLTPNWSVRAGLAHQTRHSNQALAGYDESLASLFLVYAGGR